MGEGFFKSEGFWRVLHQLGIGRNFSIGEIAFLYVDRNRRTLPRVTDLGGAMSQQTGSAVRKVQSLSLREHEFARGEGWKLYNGDSLELLNQLDPQSVDCIFADPPYFLSNGGFTCKSGKRAAVGKGGWDVSRGIEEDHAFTLKWLEACQRVLKPSPPFFSYSMSKAGLWHATRTLAQALAPTIRVNAVGPGPTLKSIHQSEADFAREARSTLLQKPTSPEEVAAAVIYLLNAPSVTGQMICVDSGQHLGWRTVDMLDL